MLYIILIEHVDTVHFKNEHGRHVRAIYGKINSYVINLILKIIFGFITSVSCSDVCQEWTQMVAQHTLVWIALGLGLLDKNPYSQGVRTFMKRHAI
jgi:hypothetical protein